MSLGVLVWVIIALVIWIISWVIAMSIPVFNNLLSLIVCFLPLSSPVFVLSISLTSPIYTYSLLFSEAGLAVSRKPNYPIPFAHTNILSVGLPAIFWFVMNKGRWFSSPRKILLTISNTIILGIGIAIVRFHCLY